MIPNIITRRKNTIDLFLRESPGATKWRLQSASTVNDAYGATNGVGGAGTDFMFDVFAGPSSTFRSPSIIRRKIQYPENVRDVTRVIFDPDDYSLPANEVPSDNRMMFLTLQQSPDGGATWSPEGPIIMIPPPDFYGVKSPLLTLPGVSPGLGAGLTAGDLPPIGSMRVVLPTWAQTITIINSSSTVSIFLSFGRDYPMMEIVSGATPSFHTGGLSQVYIANASAGSGIPFTLSFDLATFG